MEAAKNKTFRSYLWARDAPWYAKVLRSVLLIAAGAPAFYTGMSLLPGRSLNERETERLKNYCGDSFDYNLVRVHNSPLAEAYNSVNGMDATAFGNVILVRHWLAKDIAASQKNSDGFYGLVHEVCGHVRQYQGGALMALRGPWETAMNFLSLNERHTQYEYRLESGNKLSDYNLEQQASIIADYYNILRGDIPLFSRNYLQNDEIKPMYETILKGIVRIPAAADSVSP